MTVKAAGVRFERVAKTYGDVVAVHDLSFTIEPGTFVTLLGPSGCGKTTTLRLIAGQLQPSSGRIFIGERDVTELPSTERDVGIVTQSFQLFPQLTVLQNASYGRVVAGQARPFTPEAARAALAQVGLAGMEHRLPKELSGGQQQRVALARALIMEPSVMLFDEPLSNLDVHLRRRLKEDIRALQQRLGLTVIYVTHDHAEAMAISDRIVVMNDGAIAQDGTPREVYATPRDAFVAEFVGEANRLPGRLTAVNGTLARLEAGPFTLEVPHHGRAAGPVEVAIRPEAVTVGREGPLPGTVRRAVYVGPAIEYAVDTAIGPLFAICRETDRPFPAGAAVAVDVLPRGIALLPARG